ncbi:MAG: type II toxin-antitoxin system VapC family toxin [Lewinellaceae bacterium]|nr:type II toxin-antitoxin system VapC family toxin [Phaeodactylibacter sp.]MCB9351746.1 type II toxin-antitoxin system VapC family toxin [Lewinellaceae bacterium]
MSGNSLLIDTNIALYLLNGDTTIAELLNGRDVHVSFITELELLGFQDIKEEDRSIIEDLLNNCIIVDLNQAIKRITIDLKQKYKLKLPDAIIAATSIYMNLPLISADKDFERISDLQFIRYEI